MRIGYTKDRNDAYFKYMHYSRHATTRFLKKTIRRVQEDVRIDNDRQDGRCCSRYHLLHQFN